MSQPFVVTDPAAADFLASPSTRYLLGPFMQGETSMSDAAVALSGIKLNTLHRRVKQMLKLGLLEETRTETRSAHRVKLYKTTYQEFVVPLEATTVTDLEAHVDAGLKNSVGIVARGLVKEMRRCAPRWGLKIFNSGGGDAFTQPVALHDTGTELRELKTLGFYNDCGVCLELETAQAFADELQALYEKYLLLPKSKGEGDRYFLAIGFTPL